MITAHFVLNVERGSTLQQLCQRPWISTTHRQHHCSSSCLQFNCSLRWLNVCVSRLWCYFVLNVEIDSSIHQHDSTVKFTLFYCHHQCCISILCQYCQIKQRMNERWWTTWLQYSYQAQRTLSWRFRSVPAEINSEMLMSLLYLTNSIRNVRPSWSNKQSKTKQRVRHNQQNNLISSVYVLCFVQEVFQFKGMHAQLSEILNQRIILKNRNRAANLTTRSFQ